MTITMMDIIGHDMGAKKGDKKRFWSEEEKRSICLQTQVPDVSVTLVAGRYAMNANLIHKWLPDPQFSPDEEVIPLFAHLGSFTCLGFHRLALFAVECPLLLGAGSPP